MDKLDVDKPENVPNDLGKLSNELNNGFKRLYMISLKKLYQFKKFY